MKKPPVMGIMAKDLIGINNRSLKPAGFQANMEALDVDKDGEKWKLNIENEIEHANKLV